MESKHPAIFTRLRSIPEPHGFFTVILYGLRIFFAQSYAIPRKHAANGKPTRPGDVAGPAILALMSSRISASGISDDTIALTPAHEQTCPGSSYKARWTRL
jgi:hypothetical protein